MSARSSLAQPRLDLDVYFEKYVKIDGEERKRVLDTLMPKIEDIVAEVASESKGIFSKQLVRVGSHYQGLKTGKTNEFDLNVPLLGLDDIQWGNSDNTISYGFREIDDDEKARKTSRQDLTIVQKSCQLQPSTGCGLLRLSQVSAVKYQDMVHGNDLVPYLVKRKFKQLLKPACDRRKKAGISLCQQDHGPALTITFDACSYDGLDHDVSVDFAPTIRARLPYPSGWGWPRPGASWPSPQLIESVRSKGVNLVAKHNFFWSYSFAEMEKDLSLHADQPGDCRKKVHRIMKVLFKNQWRSGPSLSSYDLKNAWLGYCELIPDQQWNEQFMGTRFVQCALHFRKALLSQHLQQYFNVNKNLLEGKDEIDLKQTAQNIQEFLIKHEFISLSFSF